MRPPAATPATALKRFPQLFRAIPAFPFVARVTLAPGTAQSTPGRRDSEDTVPKHLPFQEPQSQFSSARHGSYHKTL
jgi:hypothetical protein